jgi:hypothetical protein
MGDRYRERNQNGGEVEREEFERNQNGGKVEREESEWRRGRQREEFE